MKNQAIVGKWRRRRIPFRPAAALVVDWITEEDKSHNAQFQARELVGDGLDFPVEGTEVRATDLRNRFCLLFKEIIE
jgi:hypothetical protein